MRSVGCYSVKGRNKESKPKTSVTYTAHIMAKNTDKHIKCAKRFISYNVMYTFHLHVNVCYGDDDVDDDDDDDIRESVDSLCRDGSGPPMVCVHWKAVLTRERSCSKPFWTPSYPIRTFLYSMIPPK